MVNVCGAKRVESWKEQCCDKGNERILLLGLGLSLEHVLDNLGLLDEECTDDASANATRAARATVSTADRFLTLADGAVLARAVSLDTAKVRVAVTALGDGTALLDVKVAEVSTGGLDDLSASRLGVVRVALAEGDTLSHLFELGARGKRKGLAECSEDDAKRCCRNVLQHACIRNESGSWRCWC